jgi:hypothetical protein
MLIFKDIYFNKGKIFFSFLILMFFLLTKNSNNKKSKIINKMKINSNENFLIINESQNSLESYNRYFN